MIFLILAILCSSLISVIMRFSQKKTGGYALLVMNYVMCLLLSILHVLPGDLFPAAEQGTGTMLVLGAVNGFLYLGAFVLLQSNVKANGVVLSNLFMKLGVLVPTLLSITVFGEHLGWSQAMGAALAIGGIVLMNTEKGQSRSQSLGGLILLLLTGGMADGMSKVYEYYGPAALKSTFLLVTFGVALVLCLALVLRNHEHIGRWELLFGLLLGIPNYYSSRFLLLSLSNVSAVIAYPTFSAGTILLVTLLGFLLFHEKLGKKQLAALVIVIGAIVLLNL